MTKQWLIFWLAFTITACQKHHTAEETSLSFSIRNEPYSIKGPLAAQSSIGVIIRKEAGGAGYLLTGLNHVAADSPEEFITLYLPLCQDATQLVTGAVFSHSTVHHSITRDWLGMSYVEGWGNYDDYDGTTDRFSVTFSSVTNGFASGHFYAVITDTSSRTDLVITDGKFSHVPIQY